MIFFMKVFSTLPGHIQSSLIHGPTIPGSHAVLFFTAWDFPFTNRHTHSWALCSLWLSLFVLSEAISPLFPNSIVDIYQPGGAHLSRSYPFAYSYRSLVSHGKNAEEFCHSLLQWTTFYLNSLPWPVCLVWPCTAWLIELHKAVIHVFIVFELCGSQQTVDNSSTDGNTRPPHVPPEKPVCRSRYNSENQTWNN